ncbi:hypothetical protein O0L34_g16167 [Tuta absoluta]|nr:hypothetical protein O0L34_g16167 [Tuta absoluta]
MHQFKATGPNSETLIVKLDTEQLIASLKSVIDSQFLKQMADNVASKALQKIVKDIDDNEDGKSIKTKIQQSLKVDSAKRTVNKNVLKNKIKSRQEHKPVEAPLSMSNGLDEKVVATLLREPEEDGDDLMIDSLERPTTLVTHAPMRINGVLMRRVDEKKLKVTLSAEDKKMVTKK